MLLSKRSVLLIEIFPKKKNQYCDVIGCDFLVSYVRVIVVFNSNDFGFSTSTSLNIFVNKMMLSFQIHQYEKEIRELKSEHNDCTYEVTFVVDLS